MRTRLLLLLLLISSTFVYSQSENIIYSRIITDYAVKYKPPNIDYSNGIVLVVLEKPKNMSIPNLADFDRFNKKYKNLRLDTFEDFISKNLSSTPFEEPHTQGITFVIFNKDSIPSWQEISNRYPNWTYSVLEFSEIGFNESKNQAMVYYGYNSGPGVGGGIFLIYENKGRKWKCKKVIPAWAT
jgi:hypothetical protein